MREILGGSLQQGSQTTIFLYWQAFPPGESKEFTKRLSHFIFHVVSHLVVQVGVDPISPV